jgi:Kdo2-lipid IVA lauroyltransferase/acyltransferase
MSSPAPPPAKRPRSPRARRLRSALIRVLARVLLALPYPFRVRVAATLGGRVLARLGGLPARIEPALRHYLPHLPPDEITRIAREVPVNLARLMIENFSGADFAAHARTSPLEGPGLAALQEARDSGRPAILVTAHFGNWDAGRAALIAQGFRVGGVYQPFPDPWLNARYVKAIGAVGQPLFSTGREGVAGMIRCLRGGGVIGILADLDRPQGVLLDLLGKPTRTVLSMAEMALKYDAVLVPIYGIRQPDGISFRVLLDAPIPPGTPVAMTQAINDSLSAQIAARPEQWVWWHNRRRSGHP